MHGSTTAKDSSHSKFSGRDAVAAGFFFPSLCEQKIEGRSPPPEANRYRSRRAPSFCNGFFFEPRRFCLGTLLERVSRCQRLIAQLFIAGMSTFGCTRRWPALLFAFCVPCRRSVACRVWAVACTGAVSRVTRSRSEDWPRCEMFARERGKCF